MTRKLQSFICLLMLLSGLNLHSQEIKEPAKDITKFTTVKYGSKGFEFKTADNKFLLQIQSRLQFRFYTLQIRPL